MQNLSKQIYFDNLVIILRVKESQTKYWFLRSIRFLYKYKGWLYNAIENRRKI